MRFPASRVKRYALYAVASFLLAWILFFDSHSVLKRVQLHREHSRLVEENHALQGSVDELKHDLDALDSEEVTEKVAREEYGMRKPGETVYRVEKKPEE
ncbi:MAG: septum formation initiator family protein [Bacteroidota bacterium]